MKNNLIKNITLCGLMLNGLSIWAQKNNFQVDVAYKNDFPNCVRIRNVAVLFANLPEGGHGWNI